MPKRTYGEAFSSQPVGSTQRALQESLTGNIVFANEAIVDAIFQPSKVDDKIIEDIIAELNVDKFLKTARNSVLSSKHAETKKYNSLITLFEHITTYNYQDAPLTNNDYARHVRRTWVDTHSQSIRTDPEIYLPGEINADAEDSVSEDGNEDTNDAENKNELSNVFPGLKRKTTTKAGGVSHAKPAKTAARAAASTAALNVLDDRRPDLTLIDAPVGEDVLSHPYGRHSCLYMEVKVQANKKPNPQEVVTKAPGEDHTGALKSAEGRPKVKAILRQIADIARLHLATRPFMRYSLHITLCGTIFNICLFDRVGGVVSKDYNLKDEDDFETFVRIIRRATCDMDAYELGLDPTVTPLNFLGSVARYPRFKVEVGNAEYYTYGFPIWQSTTLQGRGTWVFGATVDDNPNPMPTECLVLKSAWRASGRLPESTLYSIINKLQAGPSTFTLRCVAEFVDGGDVMVEEELQHPHHPSSSNCGEMQSVPMHVSNHRWFVVDTKLNPHDPVLHRVVLATRGRSMVSYTSLVELLSAGECAAEGLMALYERGVDHRDVSIGNVFLGTDPSKPAGFIADLDLSSISDEAIKAAYPTEHEAIISKLKHGEWRTGTALFMSMYLLSALETHGNAKKRGRPTDFTFQHKLCHDFESLILVVVYAMLIRNKNRLAAADLSAHTDYKVLLDDFWGVHSYTKLANCRGALITAGTFRWRTIAEDTLFSDPLEAEFFRAAMRLLHSQGDDQEPITYEKVQGLFRTYIQKAGQATVSTLVTA